MKLINEQLLHEKEQLKKEISATQRECASFRHKMTEIDQQNSLLKSEKVVLTQQNASLQAQLSASTNSIEQLQKTLAEAHSAAQHAAGHEHEQLLASTALIKEELQKKTSENVALEQKIAELELKLSNLQTKFAEVEKNAKKQVLEGQAQQSASKNLENRQMKERIKFLEDKIAKIQEDNDQIVRSL